jgi:hypothetical protein
MPLFRVAPAGRKLRSDDRTDRLADASGSPLSDAAFKREPAVSCYAHPATLPLGDRVKRRSILVTPFARHLIEILKSCFRRPLAGCLFESSQNSRARGAAEAARPASAFKSASRWHFLYFSPLPHQQASFRPTARCDMPPSFLVAFCHTRRAAEALRCGCRPRFFGAAAILAPHRTWRVVFTGTACPG